MNDGDFCFGVSHITFLVRDLSQSGAIFERVLGARQVYESGDRTFSRARERFYLVGGAWICLMEGEPLAEQTYNHVAFSVPDEELDRCVELVRALGLQVLPGRARVEGEGRSAYFYDYDNHLFELHTGTLKDRLRRYSI